MIGNNTTASGPDPQNTFDLRYRVVDLDDLEPSHHANLAPNPRFPAELQPRQRSRQASRSQILKIASKLQPDALIDDFHTLDRGPMIIGPDNVVESGNGRTIALLAARDEFPDKYDAYRNAVRSRAAEFGITDIGDIDDPVLVRERLTEVDRKAFTAMANQATVLTMSPVEQAVQDAGGLSDASLSGLQVGDSQSIDQALRGPANRPMASAFLARLPENERAALIDSQGNLNQIGLQRLKAAIFTKVFPGAAGQRLTTTFFESVDPQIKTIESSVFDALPKLAKAEGLVKSGQRNADLTLGDDLAKAVDMLARLKQEGMSVEEFLGQTGFFERELTPEQEKILAYLSENARSRKRVRDGIKEYADAVLTSPHPDQGSLFGSDAQESKSEILDRIFERQRKESTGESIGLFALAAEREKAGFGSGIGGETAASPGVGTVRETVEPVVTPLRPRIGERKSEIEARRLVEKARLSQADQDAISKMGDSVKALRERNREAVRRVLDLKKGETVQFGEFQGETVARISSKPGDITLMSQAPIVRFESGAVATLDEMILGTNLTKMEARAVADSILAERGVVRPQDASTAAIIADAPSADVQAFAQATGKDKMAAGRIAKTLARGVVVGGTTRTRERSISGLVDAGYRVVTEVHAFNGEPRKPHRMLKHPVTEKFFLEKDFSKTGLDFAEFLGKRADLKKAVADEVLRAADVHRRAQLLASDDARAEFAKLRDKPNSELADAVVDKRGRALIGMDAWKDILKDKSPIALEQIETEILATRGHTTPQRRVMQRFLLPPVRDAIKRHQDQRIEDERRDTAIRGANKELITEELRRLPGRGAARFKGTSVKIVEHPQAMASKFFKVTKNSPAFAVEVIKDGKPQDLEGPALSRKDALAKARGILREAAGLHKSLTDVGPKPFEVERRRLERKARAQLDAIKPQATPEPTKPVTSVSQIDAQQRFEEHQDDTSRDLKASAKRVAPAVATNEREARLQQRWMDNPGALDFEGVDTKRTKRRKRKPRRTPSATVSTTRR